jgi:uncharacterized cupin superfamily protein
MERVTVNEIEHVGHPADVNTVRRSISDALGATDVTMIYYELEPGDSFSGGLHRHHDQEEVFYVLSGTATFDIRETADAQTRTVTLTDGKAIRFLSGEFQHGYNDTDERLVALALAAPQTEHDWEQLEWLTRCRTCDEEIVHDVQLTDDRNIVATCRQCEKEITTG